MKRVGITGQAGFIGTHLANYVEERDDATLVPFEDAFFADEKKLRGFVKSCDVIIHLAAATRMPSEDALYNLNVGLVQKVIDAMEAESATPLVMFASSTHEVRDTAYGRAKREGRKRFEDWARRNGASFAGFVLPNIYGPGAKVHYVSFIANFAWELNHGEKPKVIVDALLKLKYIGNLCKYLGEHFTFSDIARIEIPHDMELKVTDVLDIFQMFHAMAEAGLGDRLAEWTKTDNNISNLYKTFLSYR